MSNILVTGSARNETGTFRRTRMPWSPERWDDGYVDNRGRFRVYRPDYPRAWNNSTDTGYALRAHVVWWVNTSVVPPKGMDVHHKDNNRLNDAFGNLELIEHAAHTSKHRSKGVHVCECLNCQLAFRVSPSRLENKRGKFCSRKCRLTFEGKWGRHPKFWAPCVLETS